MGLQNLRLNPRAEMLQRAYFINSKIYGTIGAYTLYKEEQKFLFSKITVLTTSNEKNERNLIDAFFPYNNGSLAVGYVDCMEQFLVRGAIIGTTAMNGCALEVRYNKDLRQYRFVHDKNGTGVSTTKFWENNPGWEQICRITWQGYMRNILPINKFYAVQLLCVFDGNYFHVGRWLFDMDNCANSNYSNIKLHSKLSDSYLGQFNSTTSLIIT